MDEQRPFFLEPSFQHLRLKKEIYQAAYLSQKGNFALQVSLKKIVSSLSFFLKK